MDEAKIGEGEERGSNLDTINNENFEIMMMMMMNNVTTPMRKVLMSLMMRMMIG